MRLSKIICFSSMMLLTGILLTGCLTNNKKILDSLPIYVEPKETYTIDFYNNPTKRDFFLFDSKISLFNHLNNGNYNVNDLLIEDINSLISDDYFNDYYLALLNTTVGTGSTIIASQKDNLIIYGLHTDSVTTDGIIFKSLFNSVKKSNFNINDFSFDINNDYEN